MGKNSVRNGDRLPWENHFDLRIAQDFVFGQHKLQVFFDVLNVGNLLNKDWGRAYALTNQSVNLFLRTDPPATRSRTVRPSRRPLPSRPFSSTSTT